MNDDDRNDNEPFEELLNDAGPAQRQQNPKPPKPRYKDRKQVAAIHTHFNIYRDIHDAYEGEVTVDEQLKAMERFIRWHKRQVEVGQKLYAQLVRYKQFMEGTPDAKSKAS